MNQRHRNKRRDAWRYLLALPRSLWYNLKLFPAKQAWKMPLLLSHRTTVVSLDGKVVLNTEKLRIGMIKVGFATYQGTNFRHDRTRINLQGELHAEGDCTFGSGSSLEVGPAARLTLGDGFHLGPKSLLICHHAMHFGHRNRISWNCTLMDTDQHALVDLQGNRTNPDRPITTGDNVWIGCESIITKGVQLADNTTVAAGARLAGRYEELCTVLAGNPATVVRRGVMRQYPSN